LAAISLGVVAWGYLGQGPIIFCKDKDNFIGARACPRSVFVRSDAFIMVLSTSVSRL
jgi:hypothetical protein